MTNIKITNWSNTSMPGATKKTKRTKNAKFQNKDDRNSGLFDKAFIHALFPNLSQNV